MYKAIAAIVLVAGAVPAWAQMTPEGLWRNIDDKTGEAVFGFDVIHVRKGGKIEDTVGRACLCNALTADIGLPQTRRDGYHEVPLVTLGGDLDGARRLMARHPAGWTPTQAIAFLRGE